jgi:hypothetical protein
MLPCTLSRSSSAYPLLPDSMYTSPTEGDGSSSAYLGLSIYLLIASLCQTSYAVLRLVQVRKYRRGDPLPKQRELTFSDFVPIILWVFIVLLAAVLLSLSIWRKMVPNVSNGEGFRKSLLGCLMSFSWLQMGCEVIFLTPISKILTKTM